MSINDINNAAAAMNQLKARYEGFLDDADAQIGVRQAAYDSLAADLEDTVQDLAYRRVFLDPVNGSDANDGEGPQSAVKTLPGAYSKAMKGGTLEIRIVGENTVLSFEGTFYCDARRLIISGSGATSESYPIITGGQTILQFGILQVSKVNLDSSNISLFKGFGVFSVKTLYSKITAGDFPVFTQHSSEPGHIDLNMTHTHLNDAEGAVSPNLMLANTWTFTGSGISVPSGKSWADYLNVVRAADGELRNGLSNIVI